MTNDSVTGVPVGRSDATRRPSRAAAGVPSVSIESRTRVKYGIFATNVVRSGSGVPAIVETRRP